MPGMGEWTGSVNLKWSRKASLKRQICQDLKDRGQLSKQTCEKRIFLAERTCAVVQGQNQTGTKNWESTQAL